MSADSKATPTRSRSFADRFAAFLHTPSASTASQQKSTSASSNSEDANGGADYAALNDISTPVRKNTTSNDLNSTVSSPSPSTLTSPPTSSSSGSLFGDLKSRVSSSIQAHRAESKFNQARKDANLFVINDQARLLEWRGKESMKIQHFEALDSYLTTYHDGHFLLLDIGNVLESCGCPDSLFPSTRFLMDFGFPAGTTLGAIDAAARISASARRWWAAGDTAATSSSASQNVVIVACEPVLARQLLLACILFDNAHATGQTGAAELDIMNAYHSVLLSSENRLLASLHVRSLSPPIKKFLTDYSLVHQYDPSFHVPKVWLHELCIHRLPQFEDQGTRLLVVIIANRTQFLYTSQEKGGGHLWVPTTKSDPLTVTIPLAVSFAGEASIKVWHLPEHTSVRNPRQLIFETKIHSAVLNLPCFRMKEFETLSVKQNPTIAQPAETTTSESEEKEAQEEAFEASRSQSQSQSSSALPQQPAAQAPYPLHRVFIRKDELELNSSDPTHADPLVLIPDVDYHKNFRLSVTCTPLEYVKYHNKTNDTALADSNQALPTSPPQSISRKNSEASPAPAQSSSSSVAPVASSVPPSSEPSSATNPSSDVDLLKLAAAWNQVSAASTAAASSNSSENGDGDDDRSRSSSVSSNGDGSTESPTKLPIRTPMNSVADLNPPPSNLTTPPRSASFSSTSSSSSGSRSRSSSSATPSSQLFMSLEEANFAVPQIAVPADARSTAGIRFFREDKVGSLRPESAEEVNRRRELQEARLAIAHEYGLTSEYTPRSVHVSGGGGIALIHAHQRQQVLEQQAQLQLQHEQAYRMHQAQLAQQQQQRQQQQAADPNAQLLAAEAAAQAAYIQTLSSQGVRSAEEILNDPDTSAEQKDEALARMLAEQYIREDQQADFERREQRAREEQHALAQQMLSGTPVRSSSSSRSHRSGSSRSSRSSRSQQAQPSAAAEVATPAPVQPLNLAYVAADGSVILNDSAAAGANASSDAAAAAPAAHDDEALARALQAQFDSQQAAAEANAAAAAQAQAQAQAQRSHRSSHRSSSSVIRDAPVHYDQERALNHLMSVARDRSRRGGASEEMIHQLPEFQLTMQSKYLEEECQICKEQFAAGEILRQLQCLHPYHRECIDPWLRTSANCPVCKVPLHHY